MATRQHVEVMLWTMSSSLPELSRRSPSRCALPTLEVTIEVPRGSFLKRGLNGHIDFVSPLPCPFNYGAVESYVGLEGDLLDAVVLGPRLRHGTRVSVQVFGAVGLTDRGLYDDKLICSPYPLGPQQRRQVLAFFSFYARCKGLLNFLRHRPGRNACEGWGDAIAAIARAQPRRVQDQAGPIAPF